MTEHEKEQITQLRLEGKSYGCIARDVELSENTVKSVCRRNSIRTPKQAAESNTVCPQCGAQLSPMQTSRPRRFCSNVCRMRWWNAHRDQHHAGAIKQIHCAGCGKVFHAYEKQQRRFCSHACYIASRYGLEPHRHE